MSNVKTDFWAVAPSKLGTRCVSAAVTRGSGVLGIVSRRAVTSVAAPFRHVLESAVAGASAGPAASIAALNGALAVVGPHASVWHGFWA